jgi:hypothetical protein
MREDFRDFTPHQMFLWLIEGERDEKFMYDFGVKFLK